MSEPERFPPSLPINPATFAWRLQRRPVNRVEGYEHGTHARAYLRRCAEQADPQSEHSERNEAGLAAMVAAGYSSWSKFVRHLRAWHDLDRPFPRAYADHIGVTPGQLLVAVDQDQQDHGCALATAPVLVSWVLRGLAGVYEVRPFPSDCRDEAAGVEYVRAACVHHNLHASITIRGVKTVYLKPPDGHLLVTLYTPHVKLTRAWIVFADSGRSEAQMWTV